MCCKWIGPGWFIPATSLGFGIASIGTAFVHNIHQAGGVRFVLGVFEAGMLPGIAYYLSRWYRRSELAFRLSLYIVMGKFEISLHLLHKRLTNLFSTTGWRIRRSFGLSNSDTQIFCWSAHLAHDLCY